MNPERWRQIDDLFHAASLRAPHERIAFLNEACGGDEELRREVESLLAADAGAEEMTTARLPAQVAVAMLDNPSPCIAAGQMLDQYRIISPLGAGGMGEVFLAEDTRLHRKVALKLLPAQFTRDPDRVRRFEQEARAASSLNHPNIITLFDLGRAGEVYFMAIEFIDGQTLRERLRDEERLPLGEALEIALQICQALAAAHEAGIVHRDIKPENVMLRRDGYVKVLDFGLAKVSEEQPLDAGTAPSSLTDPGTVMGTASYMSPEQARGQKVDARSDIFSLGVALYEMIAGRAPFTGVNALEVISEILKSEPLPLNLHLPDLPAELQRIVAQALRKDREQRYQRVKDLLLDLKNLKQEWEFEEKLKGRPEVMGAGEPQAVTGSATEIGSVFDAVAAPAPAGEAEAFVGREPELRRLGELLRQAIAGSGQVVFITGEPGIGKTALSDEFLRSARQQSASLIWLRGRCVEQYGTGEAYLPFLDALGALLAGPGRERVMTRLQTYAPTWCLQFPAAFSSGAQALLQRETIGATKERMLREMGDALGALAESSPVLLLLEDLHWADPSSVDLLRHLCQRISGQRALIVGTFRPADLERGNHPLKNYKREMQAHKLCEEIALGLLTPEHVAGYLDARFAPNDFSRELAALIERKTEGHPLFATSLVQFLVERGAIAKTNAHWTLGRELSEMDLEVPESVRGMIRKKIEMLEEEDRRALQYASIEGEEFTSTVVANLLGVDDLALEERLDRLDRVHRLIETGAVEELPDGALGMRYRFAHALYQNVLYGDLVSKRRMLLHRQTGEQLVAHYGAEAPRIATQLAMHFERGRDYGRAVEYLTHAGDNATKVYANAEAEQHYSYALGLTEKLPAEEQAERELPLYRKRGAVNHVMSRFDQAVEDFTQMLDRARATGSPALEHAALNALARTLFFAHRLDEVAARLNEALRVADASGNEALKVETLMLIGQRHYCLGNMAEAKEILDENVRLARALNHRPTLLGGLVWRGFVHFFQSEYERAEELLTEAVSLGSELREGFMLLIGLFCLGMTRGNLGRMSEALRTLNEAIEMARRNDDHFILPRLPNCIGWIHRELGDLDHAREHDQAGVDLARKYDLLEAEINSVINLGQDYTSQGEGEKARPLFSEVEVMLARDEWLRWRFNLRHQAGQAEYWLAQGNPERAGEYARRLLELAAHHEAHKYSAVAHKLLAEVAVARGDLAEAETELGAALTELTSYPVPIVAWKIYAALGGLRLRLGQGQAARDAYAQATAIVKEIAASVDDEKLRATFLNSAAVREVVAGANRS